MSHWRLTLDWSLIGFSGIDEAFVLEGLNVLQGSTDGIKDVSSPTLNFGKGMIAMD